jgi:hypothetical protein
MMTPHEALHGTPPKLHHLRRFGSVVYKHIPKEQRNGKFSERSKPCMMLGYVHQTTKIWRIWDFSSGPRGRAVECLNVIFAEETKMHAKNEHQMILVSCLKTGLKKPVTMTMTMTRLKTQP